VKAVRETSYGRQLLERADSVGAESMGGEFETLFVGAIRSGDDYATAAARFGMSYEMAQYTVRRLLRRYDALLVLRVGLDVLESRRRELAEIGLTDTQREALSMLLAGRSQAYVAKTLGITQAAVSSRLRLASKFLDSSAKWDWILPLAEAVRVRRKRNTLTTFQRKRKNRKDGGDQT